MRPVCKRMNAFEAVITASLNLQKCGKWMETNCISETKGRLVFIHFKRGDLGTKQVHSCPVEGRRPAAVGDQVPGEDWTYRESDRPLPSLNVATILKHCFLLLLILLIHVIKFC